MFMRSSRQLLALVALVVATGFLLLGRRDAAAQPSAPARGDFTIVQSGHGGWVVLDVRTGAMEHWVPDAYGYQVTAVGFGSAVGRRRAIGVR